MRKKPVVLRDLKAILKSLSLSPSFGRNSLDFSLTSTWHYRISLVEGHDGIPDYYFVCVIRYACGNSFMPSPTWLLRADSGAELFIKMRENGVFYSYRFEHVSAA